MSHALSNCLNSRVEGNLHNFERKRHRLGGVPQKAGKIVKVEECSYRNTTTLERFAAKIV